MNRSKLKKETLAHYDRMITWAKKQNELDQPNDKLMLSLLNETWKGFFCKYCIYYSGFFDEQNTSFCKNNTYGNCPLNPNKANFKKTSMYCCNGLWSKMNRSKTWEEWIVNAKLVKKYIKENG
jgi:hypothetical protein